VNRETKDYQEVKALLETLMAYFLYLRFGGDSAWKDPLTIDKAYEQARIFTGKLETELAKCKQA
jgi:hypothetical protein